jgi:hypothetical protein
LTGEVVCTNIPFYKRISNGFCSEPIWVLVLSWFEEEFSFSSLDEDELDLDPELLLAELTFLESEP